jgi:hypothetical protein
MKILKRLNYNPFWALIWPVWLCILDEEALHIMLNEEK